MIRAAATATELNQSDIIRTATKRYIENELVPGLTPSEKQRFDLALKMEQDALAMEKQPEADEEFLSQL